MHLVTATSGPSTIVPPRRGASPRAATPRPLPASVYRRRRLVVLLGFLGFVVALTMLFGSGGAEAELADPVAGHAVLAPGETLWDLAVATTPEGVDVRDQLAAIIELNGFAGRTLPAWTVVLLPER